ncbi:MAG TPA: tetratricopeptide repeat protein [Blastocatellia bacterium]|nr:tetratricopeptide repeat protein [Blastocatellia bacterium]
MLRFAIKVIFIACLFVVATAQTAKEQLILQAQDLLQQGRLSDARQLINQSQKTYPNDAGFANLLGIIEVQEGNIAAAEAAFKRAVTRNPKFTGAALNLGRLYLENAAKFADAPRKALQVYQRILLYDPAHVEANYQCAVLLQAAGNHQASLLHANKLPAEYQQSAQLIALLCANQVGLGNRALADEYGAKLGAHPELNEADVVAILPVLEAKQRTDLLGQLFERLIADHKASPEIFYRAGLLLEKQNQLQQARAYLEKAAGNEQPTVGLLLVLARIAHKQKDAKGALGYLAHARDLEPRNDAIHFSFGMICAAQNLGAEAHAAFGKALELAPNNPTYLYAMSVAASYRHDPGEAIPHLQKYLQLKPNDAQGKLLLGSVYYKIKDYAAAREQLQQAAKTPATAPQAYFYLGRVARQENKLEEAISLLTQALQLHPQNADAQAELGQCWLQKRDYPKAEQALQKALALDAENYAANFNLLTLYSRTKDNREAEQAAKFELIRTKRQEQMQEFLRVIEVREK